MFATHYHELTQLEQQLKHVKCYTIKIKEWQGEIVFLHNLMPGSADRSYGLYVAKLAGLPKPVLLRAQEVLSSLEANAHNRKIPKELPLFTAKSNEPQPSELEKALMGVDIDALSPRQALEVLYQLKTKT